MEDLEQLILEAAKRAVDNVEEELLDESTELDREIETGNVKDRKTVKCKKCGDVGTWTSRGSFPNGTKKWRDHNNLISNGRICGSCNQSRAKSTMQKTRSAYKMDFYQED